MEDFLKSVLSDFVAGLVLVLLTGLVTFWYQASRSKRRGLPEDQVELPEGLGVAATIDEYIARLERNRRLRSHATETPRRIIVEHRYQGRQQESSDDNAIALIFLGLIASAIASAIWTSYKYTILAILLVMIGAGIGTSIYYVSQLRKMRPPYRLEDYVWSVGGTVIWVLAAATSLLAVYNPLYPQPVSDQGGMGIQIAHLGQLIGMGLLFVCVFATTFMQAVIGWTYSRALRMQPPPAWLIALWEANLLIFGGIFLASLIALLLGTGLFMSPTNVAS